MLCFYFASIGLLTDCWTTTLFQEIQSIDPETEEEDPDSRPSFQNGGGIAIPPPTFSLNASQSLPEKVEEVEKPMPKKSINAYKSMFVKGESEFVRSKEDKEHVKSAAEDTEWPEGLYQL